MNNKETEVQRIVKFAENFGNVEVKNIYADCLSLIISDFSNGAVLMFIGFGDTNKEMAKAIVTDFQKVAVDSLL